MTATIRRIRAQRRLLARASPSGRLPWVLLSVACLTMFTMSASGTTRAPFLIDMARDLSVSVALVANLIAINSVSWGITSMLAGAGSDRWGRRPFLVGGPIALMFTTVGVATADTFFSVAVWVTLSGACCGMFSGVIFAEVSARVAPDQQGRALGWAMSGQSLTLLVGVPWPPGSAHGSAGAASTSALQRSRWSLPSDCSQ